MNKKEKIIKASGSTKEASKATQPITEQIIDNLTNNSLETLSQALADKEASIKELKEEIKCLEKTVNDLDYLLNSGRNKFEHERNKRLKELETELAQLKAEKEQSTEAFNKDYD